MGGWKMVTLGFNTQRTSKVFCQPSLPRNPSPVQEHLARIEQQVGLNLDGLHSSDFRCFPQKLDQQLFKHGRIYGGVSISLQPVTVAEPAKECTVFARSAAGI
jgi:hypothetical protein